MTSDIERGEREDLLRRVEDIIDDAMNSAIPEPWDVRRHAAKRIMDLFAPKLDREAVARVVALAGLGSTGGRDRTDPPHDGWTKEEWEARILECIPEAASKRCYRLADAIIAMERG